MARDGHILRVDGIDTTQFEKNPTFLWCHDARDLPVGTIVAVRRMGPKTKRRMEIDVEFAGLEQLHEHAERIYLLYRDGFLRAVSVSWDTLEYVDHTPKDKQKLGLGEWGLDITRSELVEISAVSVGADPDALVVRGDEGERAELREALVSVRSVARDEDVEGIDRLAQALEDEESTSASDEDEAAGSDDSDNGSTQTVTAPSAEYWVRADASDLVARMDALEQRCDALDERIERQARQANPTPSEPPPPPSEEAVPAPGPTDDPPPPTEEDAELYLAEVEEALIERT